jgi:3',5'-cyclic AMP phosphodiesterase CpdA
MSSADHRAGTSHAGEIFLALFATLLLAACGSDLRMPAPVDVPIPAPGSWTLVALPDSQTIVKDYPEIFSTQITWLAANADRLNIKYVVHEGDITNDSNDEQWATADRAFRMLDGHVPYALALGNHDYPGSGTPESRDTARFDAYFPPSRLQAQPGFVAMLDPASGVNAAYQFEASDEDWLILSLEFGPRDTVLDWAASMLAAHATSKVILVTHAYLFTDGTRLDHVAGKDQSGNPHGYNGDGQLGTTNDGQEIWDKLIAKSPNVRMVLCGHMHAQARLTSPRSSAPPVHQLLADYQTASLGGAGYLRLMTFGPDNSVQVRSYSPYFQQFQTDPDNDFVLGL